MSLFQETCVGQCLNFASGHRWLRYEEEKPGFELRQKTSAKASDQNGSSSASSQTLVDPEIGHVSNEKSGKERSDNDPNLVDWDAADDPANPMNWTFARKSFVTGEICLLTWTIYMASSIISPGTMSIMMEFDVSEPAAILGLSAYVAGYGLAPMIFGPLSEIPQIGRNPTYILTLFVFTVLQVPTALCQNIGSLISLRFVAGFFGGPVLGTGGASIGDMWSQDVRAIPIAIWGLSAVAGAPLIFWSCISSDYHTGPTLGPLLGGFAAQAEGWRITIWELLWIGGFSTIFLALFLPETSAANILTRKARRLRRVTGNTKLKSAAELEAEGMSTRQIAFEALVRPFLLMTDPIVLASDLTIGFSYALLYCWLESFPLVFVDQYGFNLGQEGLAYLGILVAVLITFAGVCVWTLKVYKPALEREGDKLQPEIRMQLGCIGCWFLPISLFTYGWTARANTHWMGPIVGAGLFGVGIFLLFQSILNYSGDTYQKYAASVFAGNDLVRSLFGAGFPPFATALYLNLGIGGASSLLGGLGLAFVPIPFVLYIYGAKIRSWSRYAASG